MNKKILEINRLKIRRKQLFEELNKDFNYSCRGALTFDELSLINLYCEHRCGIESGFFERAVQVVELDLLLEEKTEEVFLPLWRAAQAITNNLLESGRFDSECRVEKAAIFLTEVEEKLSSEEANISLAEQEKLKTEEMISKYVLFSDLLHPWIVQHAFEQYRNGHFRDSVLNAFVSLGDLMREKTGVGEDGAALATQVLSLKNPKLVLSDIKTESGRNDQIGFLEIIKGAFIGIRNPKAHSIRHDLTESKAAQYLVLASLLARRITEATVVNGSGQD